VLFIKPPSALGSLDAGIEWNPEWGNCHYECELSLRIDRTLSKENDPVKALQAVGAVTLGLDLTLRDLQDELKKKGQPWERAKASDGWCLSSDWIRVNAVVADWQNVHYSSDVKEELRQKGDTALLIVDIATLLADITQV